MSLAEALDDLTAAIPDEPAPVGGCTWCYDDWELETLAGPRDAIPADLVDRVAAEWPDEWDDFTGFYRRMAPRILGQLTSDAMPRSDDVVGRRLREACWQTWPEPERTAVLRVFEAWWDTTLATRPCSPPLLTVLENLVTATTDIRPWLDAWTQTSGTAADSHLSGLCDDLMSYRAGRRMRLGIYDRFDATEPLVDWLRNHGIERLTAAGYDTYPAELLLSMLDGTWD